MKTRQMGSLLKGKTVILHVVYHRPGLYRKESQTELKTEADRAWFSITKRILKSDAYKEMCSLAVDARHWVERRSIPDPSLGGGYARLPVSMLPEVLEKMDEVKAKIEKKADEFVRDYAQFKVEAKERLKEAYNERDYPSAQAMRRACWVEQELIEFDVPEGSKVGVAVAQAAMDQAKQKWDRAAQDVIYILREEMRELISHFAERLEVGPDGTKKRLHESAVAKTMEWLKLFKDRNILGDVELEKLAEKAAEALKGKSVETLRDDIQLRSQIKARMDEVKGVLDKLLVDAPTRAISFDD